MTPEAKNTHPLRPLLIAGLALLLSGLLAACQTAPAATATPPPTKPAVTPTPTPQPAATAPPPTPTLPAARPLTEGTLFQGEDIGEISAAVLTKVAAQSVALLKERGVVEEAFAGDDLELIILRGFSPQGEYLWLPTTEIEGVIYVFFLDANQDVTNAAAINPTAVSCCAADKEAFLFDAGEGRPRIILQSPGGYEAGLTDNQNVNRPWFLLLDTSPEAVTDFGLPPLPENVSADAAAAIYAETGEAYIISSLDAVIPDFVLMEVDGEKRWVEVRVGDEVLGEEIGLEGGKKYTWNSETWAWEMVQFPTVPAGIPEAEFAQPEGALTFAQARQQEGVVGQAMNKLLTEKLLIIQDDDGNPYTDNSVKELPLTEATVVAVVPQSENLLAAYVKDEETGQIYELNWNPLTEWTVPQFSTVVKGDGVAAGKELVTFHVDATNFLAGNATPGLSIYDEELFYEYMSEPRLTSKGVDVRKYRFYTPKLWQEVLDNNLEYCPVGDFACLEKHNYPLVPEGSFDYRDLVNDVVLTAFTMAYFQTSQPTAEQLLAIQAKLLNGKPASVTVNGQTWELGMPVHVVVSVSPGNAVELSNPRNVLRITRPEIIDGRLFVVIPMASNGGYGIHLGFIRHFERWLQDSYGLVTISNQLVARKIALATIADSSRLPDKFDNFFKESKGYVSIDPLVSYYKDGRIND